MPIIEPAIRPPGEAGSFLLQVTLGCSASTCTFCGAYMDKPFKVKQTEEIRSDIDLGAKLYPQTRNVFLMDGDAFVLSTTRLIPLLQDLQIAFPFLRRVSAYANDYNILNKPEDELSLLAENKLKLVYIGLESGNQDILNNCRKRSTVDGMIRAVHKAKNAGIKSSVIVILGLGGKEYSVNHIKDTAWALNAMQPDQLSFLTLMLVPGTELHTKAENGGFVPLQRNEFLQELSEILQSLNLKRTVLHSNHASNYLALNGRLPQDKQRLLMELEMAMKNKSVLRPEWLRGL